MLFVDGTNEDFDFGFKVSECGILKVYKKLGAEKYVPFGYILDFIHTHVLRYGLSRTKTIVNGALECNHRYTQIGSTPKA